MLQQAHLHISESLTRSSKIIQVQTESSFKILGKRIALILRADYK